MNFDWVKAPKTDREEREQFDKLYHLLVQLSDKGKKQSPTHEVISITENVIVEEKTEIQNRDNLKKTEPEDLKKTGDLDEFMRLKLDILANFQGGVEITPLQTCKGCDRSFYSEGEREKHFEQSPACLEWTKRNLLRTPLSTTPFFTFMEQGISILLTSSPSSCLFCHKPILHRKGLEKHYQQSMICNRLAYDTFQKWYQTTHI